MYGKASCAPAPSPHSIHMLIPCPLSSLLPLFIGSLFSRFDLFLYAFECVSSPPIARILHIIPQAYLSASSLYSIYPRALWPCVIKSLPSSLFSSLLCFNNTISRVLFSFSSSSLFSYASQISYDKKCSTPSFRFLALGSYWFCNLKWMFFFLFMLYLANSTISLRFALKMLIFNSFSGEGLMWREWICSHNR